MKNVVTVVARPVKVTINATKRRPSWGRIKCVTTGVTLHTGQPAYIKRVARVKYNVNLVK